MNETPMDAYREVRPKKSRPRRNLYWAYCGCLGGKDTGYSAFCGCCGEDMAVPFEPREKLVYCFEKCQPIDFDWARIVTREGPRRTWCSRYRSRSSTRASRCS